jgi:D-aminoacyl-tRNA deacylase
MGGLPRTLNTALPFQLKAAAQKMAQLAASLGWQVSVEADHHGPSLLRPAMFAEIGSSEEEWKLPEAGKIAAQAIIAAIECKESFPVRIGFGGTHYAPKFSPKIISGPYAFGHIISGYSLEESLPDAEMVMQAFEKNIPKPECAVLDWKGMKGAVRTKLASVLDECGIPWEKA